MALATLDLKMLADQCEATCGARVIEVGTDHCRCPAVGEVTGLTILSEISVRILGLRILRARNV